MLEVEATHDPLTGLPNRALLADRLDEAAAAAPKQARSSLAVLFIDLDGFKAINDGLGHLLGDKVLMAVAGRLASGLRDHDTVARFGGDEFVVLCQTRASSLLRTSPTGCWPRCVNRRSSTGTACTSRQASAWRSRRPWNPGALLRAADAAVYDAKAQGRAQVRAFGGKLSVQPEERVHLPSKLRDAL